MIQWDRNKHEINNGFEFNPGDDATVEQINGTINNALYSVDFADGLTETPDVENPDPEAYPTVSLVDYVKEIEGVQKTLKKFKFTNIKGQRGEKGEKGDKGDSVVSVRIGGVETLPPDSEATVQNIGTEQEAILVFGLPKGKEAYNVDGYPIKDSNNPISSNGVYQSLQVMAMAPYSLHSTVRIPFLEANTWYRFEEFNALIADNNSSLCYLRIEITDESEGTGRPLQEIGYRYFDVNNNPSGSLIINFGSFINAGTTLGKSTLFELQYEYKYGLNGIDNKFRLVLRNDSGKEVAAKIYIR